MITEDYVSCNIAKLLKEKGFDENCAALYHLKTGEIIQQGVGYVFNNSQWENFVSAPTLQMAMKWLRNIHDIVCSVGLFTDLPEMPPYWSFNILNQSTANVMYEAFDVKCETYEEAAEAAIKYCLENLI